MDTAAHRRTIDLPGTELHSNAREVAEFRIPLWVFGGNTPLPVKCYLAAIADGKSFVVDQTDWAPVRWDRIRRHVSPR
jgi:hypothetical protein